VEVLEDLVKYMEGEGGLEVLEVLAVVQSVVVLEEAVLMEQMLAVPVWARQLIKYKRCLDLVKVEEEEVGAE
jgi:hypothetical protein